MTILSTCRLAVWQVSWVSAAAYRSAETPASLYLASRVARLDRQYPWIMCSLAPHCYQMEVDSLQHPQIINITCMAQNERKWMKIKIYRALARDWHSTAEPHRPTCSVQGRLDLHCWQCYFKLKTLALPSPFSVPFPYLSHPFLSPSLPCSYSP